MNQCYSNYLLSQIELLRRRMIEIALSKGFTSKESIYLSQELDALLNEYDSQRKQVKK